MSRIRKELYRRAAISFLGSLLSVGLGPARVWVLTHSLSRADYGILTVLLNVFYCFSYIFSLGVAQFVAKEVPGREDGEADRILQSGMLVVLLPGGVLLALALLAAAAMAGLVDMGHEATGLRLAFVAAWLSGLFFVLNAALLGKGKAARSWLGVGLRQNLWVGLVAVSYWGLGLSISATGATALLNGGVLLAVLLLCYGQRLIPSGEDRPKASDIKRQLAYGLPLLPVCFEILGISLVARMLVIMRWGSEQTAVFSVAVQLTDVVAIVVLNAFSTLRPHLYSMYNRARESEQGQKAVRLWLGRSLRWGALLTGVGLATLVIVGAPVVRLLTKPEYLPAAALLVALAGVPALRTALLILSEPFYMSGHTRRLGGIVILGFVLSIGAAALTLPHFEHLEAACLLLTGMYAVMVVLRCVAAPRRLFPSLRQLRLHRLVPFFILAAFEVAVIRILLSPWVGAALFVTVAVVSMLATGVLDRVDINLLLGWGRRVAKQS